MIGITVEDCLKKVPNIFVLTTLLSRRVRELRRGGKALIDTKLKSPIDIAIEEIKQGKIEVKYEDEKPILR